MSYEIGREASSFSYQITQKATIIVVALAGTLTRENTASLEKLQSELVELNFTCVVLHFRNVPERADQIVIPLLSRIQKTIRDKGGQVRLASLHPNLRKHLAERGVLRKDECFDDLAQSLQSTKKSA